MRSILCLVFVLVFCASLSFGQSCPGGFWGNGQCIGACDSPLVNPNVDLKFYAWSCLGSSRIICTDGGAFCYPEYTAYDRVYGAYCGVITDYGDGECTFPYLGLDRFGPKLNRPIEIPAGLLLKARYNFLLKQARPGVKCTYTKKYRNFRKEKNNV